MIRPFSYHGHGIAVDGGYIDQGLLIIADLLHTGIKLGKKRGDIVGKLLTAFRAGEKFAEFHIRSGNIFEFVLGDKCKYNPGFCLHIIEIRLHGLLGLPDIQNHIDVELLVQLHDRLRIHGRSLGAVELTGDRKRQKPGIDVLCLGAGELTGDAHEEVLIERVEHDLGQRAGRRNRVYRNRQGDLPADIVDKGPGILFFGSGAAECDGGAGEENEDHEYFRNCLHTRTSRNGNDIYYDQGATVLKTICYNVV